MDFCEIIYILLLMFPKQTRIFDAHVINGDHIEASYVILNYRYICAVN